MNKIILAVALLVSQFSFSAELVGTHGQSIFQLIYSRFQAGTQIHFDHSMVMAGRCYSSSNPSSPYASYFIARQYSADNGPIVPPDYSYSGGSQYNRTARPDYYDFYLRDNEYQINMPFNLLNDGSYVVSYQDNANTYYKQSEDYIVALTYFDGYRGPDMACYFFRRLR